MTNLCLGWLTALALVLVSCGKTETASETLTNGQEIYQQTLLPDATPVTVSTLQEQGGRLDWSAMGDSIAFDRKESDGRYGVYTMKPDGSNVQGVTSKFPQFAGRDVGQPAWHPSGKYLLFQAEKKQHEAVRVRQLTSPGAGHFNDLWVLDVTTGRVYPIRVIPAGRDYGVLHAHFSADGKRLSWTEMYQRPNIFVKGKEFGLWKLEVADFCVGPDGPSLAHIRDFEPLGSAFYENHGFSPDGSKLIFTSNAKRLKEGAFKAEDIFTLGLNSGATLRLTDAGYNEHAIFSPDGKWIVWMSTGSATGKAELTGTDYWIMRPDGGGKRRLTYFNQPGHKQYRAGPIICADFSWRPDSKAFAAYYHTGLFESSDKVVEKILLIELGADILLPPLKP